MFRRRPDPFLAGVLGLAGVLSACQPRVDDLPQVEVEAKSGLRLPPSAQRLRSHLAREPRPRIYVRVEIAKKDLEAFTGRLCRLGPRTARRTPALPSPARSWWSPAAASNHRYCQGTIEGRRADVVADTTRGGRPIVYVVEEL